MPDPPPHPSHPAELHLRAQVYASSVLAQARSVEEALPELLAALGETLAWDEISFWQPGAEGLACTARWPAAAPDGAPAGAQPAAADRRVVERAFRAHEPAWRGAPQAAAPATTLAVPATVGAQVAGVLALHARRAEAPDAQLVAALGAIASHTAAFLERRRIEAEHEAAERERRRLVDRLEMHLERMPVACVICDEELRVVHWNPAAERIFGWRAEEVLGRDPFETFIPPESRGYVEAMLEQARQGADPVVHGRNPNRRRDGSRIDCEWINTPLFDEAGRFVGLVSMAQDVTERARMEASLRASEERYRTIVETAREGVWSLDAAGRTAFASGRMGELLGCDVADLMGRPLLEFVTPEDRPAAEAWLASLGDEPPALHDLRLTRSGGGLVWVQVSATPLRDERGRRTGSLLLLSDVTERRALEARLLHAQKMEALGRLAGGVAHDFNNVLTVIGGYGELLLGALEADDPRRELVEEICKAGERAASLTRQLLAFSRRVVREVKLVDLNERIADQEEMFRRLVGEHIELHTRLTPAIGRVRVDPAQLDQVVMNLVVNARDAMPDGGRLEIETAETELDEAWVAAHPGAQPGPHVRLTVRDTGSGIEPASLPHIFEPFFTTKEVGRGTGLGLATVYGVVKQSGGYVMVESARGRGTAFHVHLPRADGGGEAPDARERGAPDDRLAAGSGTLLLVEDEPSVRAFARRVLEAAGYRVLEAASGPEALRVWADFGEPIDLLVTDVVMPGMSGRALAERLRSDAPDLPVLFLSGYTDDAVLRHGVLEDGAAFLQKPCTPAALTARVGAVLDAARAAAKDPARPPSA